MIEPLRMGMLGGGPDSFMGRVHLIGAQLAGVRLAAGVFSSDPERCRAAGFAYGVEPDRCYPSTEAMLEAESRRSDGIRMVAIATPNNLHLAGALQALEAGLHVLSDKPATTTLAEALRLQACLETADRVYAITFTNTGFPMIREARARIAAGEVGTVRKVIVTYLQGFLAGPGPHGWRTDPGQSGIGGTIADIGTHAFNLVEHVTGVEATDLLARLGSKVPGHQLDDDCNVLLRLANGADAVILATQIAYGERSGLSLQVYGDRGAVHWSAAQADTLRLVRESETRWLSSADTDLLVPMPVQRGIGNGLIAPFAFLYSDFAAACAGERSLVDDVLPGIRAAVRSMRFVDRAIESDRRRSSWVQLDA